MLVGSAQGGVTAAEVAAAAVLDAFVIDQVVTAGAPSAQVPRIPEHDPRAVARGPRATRWPCSARWSTRCRATGSPWSSTAARSAGTSVYVAGGRAADGATHPELRAEIERIHELPATSAADPARPGQRMSCTNSPSWVRLRHSTIGTTSP